MKHGPPRPLNTEEVSALVGRKRETKIYWTFHQVWFESNSMFVVLLGRLKIHLCIHGCLLGGLEKWVCDVNSLNLKKEFSLLIQWEQRLGVPIDIHYSNQKLIFTPKRLNKEKLTSHKLCWSSSKKTLMSIKVRFLEFIIRHKWMLKSFSINSQSISKMESTDHKTHFNVKRSMWSTTFNRENNQEKLLKHRKNDLQRVVLRLETLFTWETRQQDSSKKEVVKETWAT